MMNLLKDNRNKYFVVGSLYTALVFILYIISPKGLNLKYFFYVGYLGLGIYNLEAFIQILNSGSIKKVLPWLALLYGVSFLGRLALYSKIDLFYMEREQALGNRIQEILLLRDQLTLYKEIIKLVFLWGRSFVLLGLVKEFVSPKA
ncbi:MAG: hypothetical protein Q4E37_04270 [Tissierellia bacterium]|nr:hypothetical protein [Tissierellia bacterium]